MKKLNLVVVDDDLVVRTNIIEIFELSFSEYRIGEFALESIHGFKDGKEFLEYAKLGHPIDVVILDMDMPVLDGVGVLEICKKLGLKYNFVLFSGFTDAFYLKAGQDYSVKGYIYKGALDKQTLFDPVIAASKGGSHTCREFFDVLAVVSDHKLTLEELHIAHLTHKGLMEKEIAEVTGISESIIKHKKKKLKDKLGLKIFKEIFDLLPFNKKSDNNIK